MDFDEKGRGRQEKASSTRFSHYVPVQGDTEPVQPPRPMPAPAFHRGRSQRVRPVQRLGVGTSNGSSTASLPLDQIGVAISAELDGRPVTAQEPTTATTTHQARPGGAQAPARAPLRPVSTMTEETVFEEDDLGPQRGSSVLLPLPPVPVPPIRTFQPSRTGGPNSKMGNSDEPRRSELFLNVSAARQERPPRAPQPATRPRLAPPFQMVSTASSYESKATTASSRDDSSAGDIIDYYFSTHASREATPKASPALMIRPKESPKTVQIKPKKSYSSTLSQTSVRTWTNQRDSLSSQTSFETADANDPTPEDEDDSSGNKPPLSPVAESPISNVRYPKVPRASNQMVARSPPQHRFRSPHRAQDASALLQKRNNALPPLLLESRPRLESPHRDPFTSPPRMGSPPRKGRAHVRSNSTESWNLTAVPRTGVDRKSRVQSGAWGKSPVMYEEDVVRPLNVSRRRGGGGRRDEMSGVGNMGRDADTDFERDGLKSPAWVPRLTPRKKGEDLFLEVGWGDGAGRR